MYEMHSIAHKSLKMGGFVKTIYPDTDSFSMEELFLVVLTL